MSGDAARLTIVVPAFNEARRLGAHAARLVDAAATGALDPSATELIVVDDGSTDGTGARAEEFLGPSFPLLRVIRLHDNSGKGAAVRIGTAAAAAPVVAFLDADMSVDPLQLPGLVSAVGSADMAIGSRSLENSVVVTNGIQRKLMGRAFNLLVHAATSIPFGDTQCGFKAFRTPMARILFSLMTVDRFAFDVELISLARRLQMDIAEVAVEWHEAPQSTVRAIADPLSMTRDLLHLRRQRSWPHLAALAVTTASGERRRSQPRILGELHRALGSNFPILSLSEGRSLVLLPLCGPIEVQQAAERLRQLPTRFDVSERSVSLDELVELAPLKWLASGDDGIVVPARSDISEFVTGATLGPWQPVRLPRSNGHQPSVSSR